MFVHSFSNPITLDWNEVYQDSKQKSLPIKYVMPNVGVGNKLSSDDDKNDDVDHAITQVQVEELPLADEFVTPKKAKG
jgi:hypothetical protein